VEEVLGTDKWIYCIFSISLQESFKKKLIAKLKTEEVRPPMRKWTQLTTYISGYIIKKLLDKVYTKRAYVDNVLLLQSNHPTGLDCTSGPKQSVVADYEMLLGGYWEKMPSWKWVVENGMYTTYSSLKCFC